MDVYEELVRLRNLGQKCALATIVEVRGSIPSYESAKLLVREDGSMTGTIGGGCVEAEVWNAAREVIETEKPKHLTFNLGQDARAVGPMQILKGRSRKRLDSLDYPLHVQGWNRIELCKRPGRFQIKEITRLGVERCLHVVVCSIPFQAQGFEGGTNNGSHLAVSLIEIPD